MKLYTLINHWYETTTACESLEEAKELLYYEMLELCDDDKASLSSPCLDDHQIVGNDGYIFCEIQTLDVDLLWDIETLAILQQANNL